MTDYEQRAAYAAIATSSAPVIGRVGHRLTQLGDQQKAKRTLERSWSVWYFNRFQDFATTGRARRAA